MIGNVLKHRGPYGRCNLVFDGIVLQDATPPPEGDYAGDAEMYPEAQGRCRLMDDGVAVGTTQTLLGRSRLGGIS